MAVDWPPYESVEFDPWFNSAIRYRCPDENDQYVTNILAPTSYCGNQPAYVGLNSLTRTVPRHSMMCNVEHPAPLISKRGMKCAINTFGGQKYITFVWSSCKRSTSGVISPTIRCGRQPLNISIIKTVKNLVMCAMATNPGTRSTLGFKTRCTGTMSFKPLHYDSQARICNVYPLLMVSNLSTYTCRSRSSVDPIVNFGYEAKQINIFTCKITPTAIITPFGGRAKCNPMVAANAEQPKYIRHRQFCWVQNPSVTDSMGKKIVCNVVLYKYPEILRYGRIWGGGPISSFGYRFSGRMSGNLKV